MISKTFRVTDMHCSNCVLMIEGMEDDLAGIKSVSASYQKAQVIVEFDQEMISEDQIIAEINRRGYSAVPME